MANEIESIRELPGVAALVAHARARVEAAADALDATQGTRAGDEAAEALFVRGARRAGRC